MPPPEAGDDDNPLLLKLRERIHRDGPLTVDAYMQACIGDPEHGYWRRCDTIGAAGDFVTAPEISQIFGELVGLWCVVTWQQLGSPKPLRLIELGPGRGTLMRDALRSARKVPGFLESATVHLVEISSTLREAQREMLLSTQPSAGMDPRLRGDDGGPSVTWHDGVGEVPEGAAIIVANEFLDALPIRQLVHVDGAWHERMVALDAQDALTFAQGEKVNFAADASLQPKAGAIIEVRQGEDLLLAQLAARRDPLVALFIDYGPASATVGDTLQAVRRHGYVDPLAEPGTADLTAHVLFAGLVGKVEAAGLAADGPMTQAEFLGRLGIAERATRLMAANPAKAAQIEAGVQRLMAPTGMGQLFKVLAVRSPTLPAPAPFG
jgi:NADH dehydrogenase [ubiquinone] 1 alpha subcomplex assembly factor 7